MIILLAIFTYLIAAASEVKISSNVQSMYDDAPQLSITGTGFDADADSIDVEISTPGNLSLRNPVDFEMTKSTHGLTLYLVSGEK